MPELLFGLMLNIVAPLAAKRFNVVRKLMWTLFAAFLAWATYFAF